MTTAFVQEAIRKVFFILPRARAFATSVFITGGLSNPCDDCVATRDWMVLLLLGSKGVISLQFFLKSALIKCYRDM